MRLARSEISSPPLASAAMALSGMGWDRSMCSTIATILAGIVSYTVLALTCMPLVLADEAPAGYVNISVVDNGDRDYLLDFLSGVALAKEGTIARLYQDVFICSPRNIGIIEE